MAQRTLKRWGWLPDLPDRRDRIFPRLARTETLPSSVDLRPGCPPVYDQGDLGSCTANALAGAMAFVEAEQGIAPVSLSRLFIYYNERVIEGTVEQDAGAMIRDGMASIAKQGACLEDAWPYDPSQFTVLPSDVCYFDGQQRRAVTYLRVTQDLQNLKGCLAAGFPVVFGFTVYESFESAEVAKTGNVPMPTTSEAVLGGHAVLLVGYDEASQRWLVRNSWGDGWGMAGYFTMPFEYLLDANLSDDFWTMRKLTTV